MITKSDCLLLLDELKDTGINVDDILQEAYRSQGTSVKVVDFINKHRPFEAGKFYEKMRKSYNDKHSKLYKNIVTDENANPNEALLTLSSLELQILLYAKNVEDREFFLRQVRFEDITRVLANYCKTYDLVPCLKLLHLIKADLKAFECMK